MMYRGYRRFAVSAVLVLIAVNIGLFIARVYNPDLIFTLGLTPAIWTEKPWTILTCIFVHGSLWHIIANMITLFFFGSYLVSLVGDLRFLAVYFLGGIAGSLFYIWLGPGEITAIGASGAVFAVGGAFTVLAPRLKVFIFPIPAPVPLWAAVIGGFLIISFFPYVAWQAHLGGLLLGLAAGFIFKRWRRMRYPPVLGFRDFR